MALLFLDEHYRQRFAFTAAGDQTIDGRRAVVHEFTERSRPTVIQEPDRDVPASGTIWIEAATGRVLQTSLIVSGADGRLSSRMTVRYGPHPKFNVLLPLQMHEVYLSSSGEEITATAAYSDFRRFETVPA